MPASRSLVSEVVTYNVRVWLAGLAAAVLVPLSLVALVVDLVTGGKDDPDALARRVLQASARLEASLDVHGALTDVRVAETA
ncbi:hypothetical protein [Rubrivirga sp.]|uniref:hypothetical protein n=1 Tax=Rubrivirga sp. TaxID=1885344 RepID=UPI003B51E9EC